MRNFARLIYGLGQTKNAQDKVNALLEYFKNAPHEDILWAIALFSGRRPKRAINHTQMREWGAEYSGIPLWLIVECEGIAGDKSETVSLLLPEPETPDNASLAYWVEYLKNLSAKTNKEQKEAIFIAWGKMVQEEKFVFGKLLSGTFRIDVSQNILVRALSKFTGVDTAILTHRLTEKWEPDTATFDDLFLKPDNTGELSKPYPFFLACPLDVEIKELGEPAEWIAEWELDGLRTLMIKRGGQFFIWDKGGELITAKFPELEILKNKLPDGCVVDGMMLPYIDGKILPSSVLQTRVGRKNFSAKTLKEMPVSFFAFDLLEYNGEDIRGKQLIERRKLLVRLIVEINHKSLLQPPPEIHFNNWEELASNRLQARENNAGGIILKRKTSAYQAGRQPRDWLGWKTDLLSIDAVLIYAAQGTGRHANLFTEYTFGVWHENMLVTIAKANSGLSNREIIEVDSWIKKNIAEKFGPVRTVKPALVFEIGFEGIGPSARHKSGIALRLPHILHWRRDKKPEAADTLDRLKAMLENKL